MHSSNLMYRPHVHSRHLAFSPWRGGIPLPVRFDRYGALTAAFPLGTNGHVKRLLMLRRIPQDVITLVPETKVARLCIVEVNVGQAKGLRLCRAGWARVANNGAAASFSRYGRILR